MPTISVVICTYNREKYLPLCLEHLKNQTAPKESFEIVIINNNSKDLTDLICSQFISNNPELNVTYDIEYKPGLSHARNRGIELSIGEIICFIDDDGFVFPDYIMNLIELLKKHKNISAFGGRIYPVFESSKPNWMSRWLLPLISVLDLGEQIKLFNFNSYPIGANMGFKKSLISEVGFFNTELGRIENTLLGGEEKDFFYKIRRINIPIYYIPNLRINHIIPDSRLSMEYIKKMGIGIGISEQIRAKNLGNNSYYFSIIKEALKWLVSFILALFYLFLSKEKSTMLLLFRSWVTAGLLNKNHFDTNDK